MSPPQKRGAALRFAATQSNPVPKTQYLVQTL
jgi:hypothetical protein